MVTTAGETRFTASTINVERLLSTVGEIRVVPLIAVVGFEAEEERAAVGEGIGVGYSMGERIGCETTGRWETTVAMRWFAR
jgi:hypothetical protein